MIMTFAKFDTYWTDDSKESQVDFGTDWVHECNGGKLNM